MVGSLVVSGGFRMLLAYVSDTLKLRISAENINLRTFGKCII